VPPPQTAAMPAKARHVPAAAKADSVVNIGKLPNRGAPRVAAL
jgi:hypothetical protein